MRIGNCRPSFLYYYPGTTRNSHIDRVDTRILDMLQLNQQSFVSMNEMQYLGLYVQNKIKTPCAIISCRYTSNLGFNFEIYPFKRKMLRSKHTSSFLSIVSPRFRQNYILFGEIERIFDCHNVKESFSGKVERRFWRHRSFRFYVYQYSMYQAVFEKGINLIRCFM